MEKKDLTVLIPAKNNLDYIQVCINSFLEFYPDYKNNIVVFDDESTDGTKEWLEQENIKRISWKNYAVKKQFELKKFSFIIVEAMLQIHTKYLLMLDSDIFFLRGGFIEFFEQKLKEGYKVISPLEYYVTKRFTKIHKNNYDILKHYYSEEYDNCIRVLTIFSFVDLEYLKKINCMFDNVKNKYYTDYLLFHNYLEVGTDFYQEIIKREVPFYELKNQYQYTYDVDMEYFKDNDTTFIYHIRLGNMMKLSFNIGIKDIKLNNFYSFLMYKNEDLKELVYRLKKQLVDDIRDPILVERFKKCLPWMWEK